ncbi:hypothetical protein [Glutamicibacter arilaitensis]|uniref:hypothetical protein n=1 Tax=Glutamicibacter arilaitensis TaxID=256701 RepID=UPI003A8CBDFB
MLIKPNGTFNRTWQKGRGQAHLLFEWGVYRRVGRMAGIFKTTSKRTMLAKVLRPPPAVGNLLPECG